MHKNFTMGIIKYQLLLLVLLFDVYNVCWHINIFIIGVIKYFSVIMNDHTKILQPNLAVVVWL